MKYSYSPTAGLQSAPSATHAHRPSLSQPSLPPRPSHHYSYSVPQSPPATGSPYASFPGSQPQPPYPNVYGQQTQSPPASAKPTGHTASPSTGYSPVDYDGPGSGGYSPEQFYGSLIDMNNRPSEVFSRLSDALFFWLDHNCDLPGLRGTGVIEPAKYAWMSSKMGAAVDACEIVQQFLPSFYEMASIPHRYAQTRNGQVPVVDRRGWLHMSVFEARASPIESHQHWNKAISLFCLMDPKTNTPFPSPIPRASLPSVADLQLSMLYSNWRTQAIIGASRARTNAMVQNIIGQQRTAYNPYAFMTGAGAGGFGGSAFGNNGFGSGGSTAGGGGGGAGSDDGSHATVMDTVNTLGTLANTILGGFGGGGAATGFGTTNFFGN